MMKNKPYVQIIEQPAEKSFRFRYESEGRLSGSILGAKATNESPSYPTIKIGNYTGTVCIRISCVTHNDSANLFRQHPHKLSRKGQVRPSGEVWLKHTIKESKEIVVKDIGIVFIKNSKIEESLKNRKSENIDPTKGGWDNISRPHLFDLHCVRLCFEVFTCDESNIEKPKYTLIGYDVSTPLMDKKSNGSLKIVDMSLDKGSVLGGDKMIILCDKVRQQDISVMFYEEDDDGNIVWQEIINHINSPNTMKVHHQYAISLQTPKYKEFDIRQPTKNTFVKLVRSKDNEYSESFLFQFEPSPQSVQLQRKKKEKVNETTNNLQNTNAAPVKKVNKSIYVPNIQVENIPTRVIRKKNTVKSTQPIQPTINNLDKGKENKEDNTKTVLMPTNNQVQNTFQTLVEPNYQRQTTNTNPFDGQYNFPSGSYPNSNIPAFYYGTPVVQHQNVNNHFVEPSNAQTSYILQPTLSHNMYQQQQAPQSSQPPQANIYAGYVGDRMVNSTINYPMDSAMNCIPLTCNNDTNVQSNKAVEYSVNNIQAVNDNAGTNTTNFPNLTSSELNYFMNDNTINENDVDNIENISEGISSMSIGSILA